MKTLGDIQNDAVKLHALCQGANELVQDTGSSPSASGNALYALLEVLEEKADALACNLDRLQLGDRATQKANGQTSYLGPAA